MGWILRVIALLGAACVATSALAEPRIALVIGNGAYDARLGPLANPVKDAAAVAGALRRVGFEVEVLTDLDQKSMKRAISRFGQRLSVAGPEATGLFFYAGHGLQSGGVNYLAPIGAAIETEADIDLETVAAEAVMKQLESAGVGTVIVVLDACRNTPVLRANRSASRGLARMDAPTGSFVAYSTAPGQTADDGDKGSPFAQALVANLGRPGEPIEVVFRNIRQSVREATGGRQTPWDSSSLVRPFYFGPGPGSATAVPPSISDAKAIELAFWNSVGQSNDPSQYRAYLAQFPNGAFAALARAKVANLQPATPVSPAKAGRPAPTSITQPDWIRVPTADEFVSLYPDRAQRMEVAGTTKIRCKVLVSGQLDSCIVVSEMPEDFGFGDAALKMAPFFQLSPRSKNGEPVAGGYVSIPITFKVPE